MLLSSDPHKRARIITVIACTTIALACGTNYGYSIWGPSFAARLKLSATDSNLIGTIGNLGMYAFGVPSGMMVDAKGPRWGVTLGVIFFAVGYYPIARAYEAGPGAYSVGLICLFSFFSGAGSCTAFSSAIKAAALNFPESRGTATAFPLAAFGLSAMFFAAVDLLLPSGTYNFLVLLAVGTVALPLLSFPFLRVIPPQSYHKVAQHERQVLHRTRAGDPEHPHYEEPGAPRHTHKTPSSASTETPDPEDGPDPGDEQSSLLSRSSGDDVEDLASSKHTLSDRNHESPHLDIRGFALLPLPEFWQLFSMLGLLTGIGLMTINNIGNDAQALWKHYDPNTTSDYIQKRQAMHVAILSFCSFAGRLTSGIGSDILVSKLGRSRFWCLFASAITFCVAQLAGTAISHPKMLVFLSGLTGFAYGMLFGVYPSLVAHCFGVHGLSQNWGTMTLAPVVSGNIFNILYGKIYDAHSIKNEDGDRECLEGRQCYSTAYWVTFGAAILGVGCCLWSIWHEYKIHKQRNGKEGERLDHERTA
ncbi:major facilitator superfamily domain-containing protein [Exophiala viscosa]|uniref:Major facilitator superfamily domain-containing protein n=1 Tax=Exophiala viscosa TaxID=2486360 RepID=A0AAN6DWN1_9EURO|nr:major facilitator superfamily domain-containing protein [Exophiala viscosa]